MIKRIMILSAALMLLNAAGEDSQDPPDASEQEEKTVDIQTVVKGKNEKIQSLTVQHRDLLEKQKRKRKELLKNNPKIRRMYLQILKQARQLALELDANREIRQINDQLQEIEKTLEKEKNELNKLKETEKSK